MAIKVKPMSPTKKAFIEKSLMMINSIIKDLEQMGMCNKGNENVASMLKASVDLFSENVEGFRPLGVEDKLFSLAQESLKSALVLIRLLKKSLDGEVTQEIKDLMKKSGLFCSLTA